MFIYFDAIFINKLESRETKYLLTLKDDSKEILNLMFRLSALYTIEKNIADWYENGYLNAEHGAMIRDEIKVILKKMKRFMMAMTDSFKPADEKLDCMICPPDGDLYKSV